MHPLDEKLPPYTREACIRHYGRNAKEIADRWETHNSHPLLILYYSSLRGNRIELCMYKDIDEWCEFEVVNKLDIHYSYCARINYPTNCSKELIYDIIINVLLDIYKDGNIKRFGKK